MLKKLWIEAWICRSPHRPTEPIYTALARAASTAFAQLDEEGRFHVDNLAVVQPPLLLRAVLADEKRIEDARATMRELEIALGWYALGQICDAVRQASQNLSKHLEKLETNPQYDDRERKKVVDSLNDKFNGLAKKVKTSPLLAAQVHDWASILSSGRYRTKLFSESLKGGPHPLIPRLPELNFETAVDTSLLHVANLVDELQGVARWGAASSVVEGAASRAEGTYPTRGDVRELVKSFTSKAEKCKGWPMPEGTESTLRADVAATLKALEACDGGSAYCEGGIPSTKKACDGVAQALINIAKLLTSICDSEQCFRDEAVTKLADKKEQVDYLLKFAGADAPTDGPLLPKLLVQAIEDCSIDLGFDEALQTTVAVYLKASHIERDFAAQNSSGTWPLLEALSRYREVFKAANGQGRGREMSFSAPVQQHFVARLWLLAVLFRAAWKTSEDTQRDARICITRALLGMVVGGRENSDLYRFDFLEALPYAMRKLHLEQPGLAAVRAAYREALPHEMHELHVKCVSGKCLNCNGEVERSLSAVAESLTWELHPVTYPDDLKARKNATHHLYSEGYIHGEFGRPKHRNTYSLNKSIEILQDEELKGVVLDAYNFKPGGSRPGFR